ncbi:hypothetical protein JCM17823_29040 [Halorubrum gandharaense]
MPSRRALLAALGAAGTVGGIGFWQRRRLRRREELTTLETVRDVELQSEPDTELLTVTPDHVAASYDRAHEHLQETLDYLGDDPPSHMERHVDRARERLDDTPPDEQPDDAAREAALDTYRLAVASSATARGGVLDHGRDSPSDELREAHDALVSALDAADPGYPGERLTRTVVQCGEVDDLLGSASTAEQRVRERYLDDAGTVAWERVEVARCRVYDAEQLVEPLGGPERADALASAFEALAERTKANADPIDFTYDGDVPNHASDRWMSAQLSGGGPENAADDGRYAAAVREQAERAAVAATLDAFTEYPSYRRLHEMDEPAPGDASEVLAVKRDAVEAVAEALDEVGGDPLGNQLLGTTMSTVERGDRRVDRLIEEVQSYDDDEWNEQIYRALITYRGAALEAEAVPGIVEVVAAVDRGG